MRCFKMHWQNSILSLISKMYNPKQNAMKIGTSCIPVANIAFCCMLIVVSVLLSASCFSHCGHMVRKLFSWWKECYNNQNKERAVWAWNSDVFYAFWQLCCWSAVVQARKTVRSIQANMNQHRVRKCLSFVCPAAPDVYKRQVLHMLFYAHLTI